METSNNRNTETKYGRLKENVTLGIIHQRTHKEACNIVAVSDAPTAIFPLLLLTTSSSLVSAKGFEMALLIYKVLSKNYVTNYTVLLLWSGKSS